MAIRLLRSGHSYDPFSINNTCLIFTEKMTNVDLESHVGISLLNQALIIKKLSSLKAFVLKGNE